MKYYIVTNEVFNELDENSIDFALLSLDGSQWVVTTTEIVGDTVLSFKTSEELSLYTFEEGSFWTGDNTGVEEWEMNETEYINEF
jgi:hypothetical protein